LVEKRICIFIKDPPQLELRADMDALPMDYRGGKDWHSHTAGVAHNCRHDGQTVALLGLARHLAAHPPASGRVVTASHRNGLSLCSRESALND